MEINYGWLIGKGKIDPIWSRGLPAICGPWVAVEIDFAWESGAIVMGALIYLELVNGEIARQKVDWEFGEFDRFISGELRIRPLKNDRGELCGYFKF